MERAFSTSGLSHSSSSSISGSGSEAAGEEKRSGFGAILFRSFLQFPKHRFRFADHMLRHPGELRHRDTVALACRPLSDFVQENHFSAALHRFDVYICDFRAGLREHREFKVMRREKRVAAVRSASSRAMAPASDRPSKVDVPRPISSMRTSDRSVA